MSPITFLELSLTVEEERRDKLLGFAQHLLHEEILPAPEELVIQFIGRGCQLIEKRTTLRSRMPLAKVWRKVTSLSDETFQLHQSVVQPAAAAFRTIGHLAESVLKNRELDPHACKDSLGFQIQIALVRDRLKLKPMPGIDFKTHQNITTLTIFFILVTFCCLITPYAVPYEEFWQKLKISNPLERLEWVISEQKILFCRGAFVELALAALTQIQTKTSRGLYFDAFHSLYLPYVDRFLTIDPHFLEMAKACVHPNSYKIFPVHKAEIIESRMPIDYPLRRIKE